MIVNGPKVFRSVFFDFMLYHHFIPFLMYSGLFSLLYFKFIYCFFVSSLFY